VINYENYLLFICYCS